MHKNNTSGNMSESLDLEQSAAYRQGLADARAWNLPFVWECNGEYVWLLSANPHTYNQASWFAISYIAGYEKGRLESIPS